jgi:hypothetical protein
MVKMERSMKRVLVLGVAVIGCTSVFAGELASLNGPDIIASLSGKSVRGNYADGSPFTETFWPDGKDSYWDPRGTSSGHWSVARDLMCFEYDAEFNMAGGCFRVVKVGTNCFAFYAMAQNLNDAPTVDKKPHYTARAAADGAPETCPSPLQV